MRSAPAPGELESPALALVNSLHRERRGLVDDIGDVDSLDQWLTERLATPAPIGSIDVALAHDLRGAIRVVFDAVITGEPAPREAVKSVNEAAAAAPGVMALQPDLTREWHFAGGSAVEQLLAMFARDAIALTTGDRAGDLVACPAPNCVRLLLRDHNRRQWCGTKCGDRVRAARYHARQLQEGELLNRSS
jgi:predicted RNA-binding Zn ribbon-like protein